MWPNIFSYNPTLLKKDYGVFDTKRECEESFFMSFMGNVTCSLFKEGQFKTAEAWQRSKVAEIKLILNEKPCGTYKGSKND